MSCLLRHRSYFVVICALFVLLGSCSRKGDVPAYIHIDHIDLTTDAVTQGSNSARITDAWVYVDGQLIGTFELPATFPVLAEGTHEIKIRGGIKQSGISSSRVQYPFYKFYSTSVNLIPGNVTNVQPVVSYFPATTFSWLEDFESPGTTINPGPFVTDTMIVQQNAVVFEGSKSGAVILDNGKAIFYASSATGYSLPQGEQSSWLELDYKTNNAFTVGVLTNHASFESFPTITLYPTDTWNKIYIDLSAEVSAHNGPYYIFFSMVKTSGVSIPQLYIDNIKLVH